MDGCRHRRWRRWLFPAECAQCGRQTFCGTPAPPCPPAAPWSDHVQPADRKGTIISLLMLHRKGMTSLLVSSGISSSYSKYNVKLMRTSECLCSSKMKDDRLILNTFFFLKEENNYFIWLNLLLSYSPVIMIMHEHCAPFWCSVKKMFSIHSKREQDNLHILLHGCRVFQFHTREKSILCSFSILCRYCVALRHIGICCPQLEQPPMLKHFISLSFT